MQERMAISDLEVDHIIEKVLIKATGRHNYLSPQHNQLTPSEHLWHYQLQEENVDLKSKISQLKGRSKKLQERFHREERLTKEVALLRKQLEDVLVQNGQIQKDINRLRVRNSRVEETSRRELEESAKRSQSKRQCSCEESRSHSKVARREKQKVYVSVESPLKQQPDQQYSSKDASTNCQLDLPQSGNLDELKRRKERIYNLKQLISNQQNLISSYKQQISLKQQQTEPKHRQTVPDTTSRYESLNRPQSMTTFKKPSIAGSIVKMRR